MMQSFPKPNELTSQFVRLLHESQGTHVGYFQIVQFHQKRQKYYSTHISDGYFKCKVILKDKASKQIDRGDIKLFSILHGPISNQGNRILMVFNQLKFWDYPRTVGVIRSWRFESANNYLNGNNLIQWFPGSTTDKPPDTNIQESENDTVSISSYCASESNFGKRESEKGSGIKLKNRLSTNSLQSHAFSFGVNNKQQISASLDLGSTQSLLINKENEPKPKMDLPTSKIAEPEQKTRKLLIVAESQSENNASHLKSAQKMNEGSPNQRSTKKVERFSRVSEVPSFNEASREKMDHSRKKTSQAQPSHSNDEDDDLFEEMKVEMTKIRQRKVEELLEQPFEMTRVEMTKSNKSKLLSNSKVASNEKSACKSLCQSRRKSLYEYSASSDEQGSRSFSNIKPKMSNTKVSSACPTPKKRVSLRSYSDEADLEEKLLESKELASSWYRQGKQISLSELSIGNDTANRNKNWISVMIICIKSIEEPNNSKLIVVAEEFKKGHQGYDCGYIFNIVLNAADVQCPFQEGTAYQMSLSGFSVVEPVIEQMFVSMELKNNSQDVRARKIEAKTGRNASGQNHFCYMPISKIEETKQGVSLNIVGLVYRYKNVSNRKKNAGWTNIFTIIDPFTASCVNFTVFDTCKLIYEPGSPVVVYNAVTKMYQGKVTINVRNYTLYYFGKDIVYDKFCAHIPQLEKIRQWQQQGNSVGDIISMTQNYRQIGNLLQTELISEKTAQELLNVETPVCRVVKISPFFFRLICDTCNKKLNKGSQNCFNCGRRESPLKELQLSLQVSDNSHSIFVEFNHYDSMTWIGEQGEKLQEFAKFILHKRIKLWLRLNPKYKASVIKMQVIDEGKEVRNRIQQLKNLLKFM